MNRNKDKNIDPFLVKTEERNSKLIGFSSRLEWTENSFIPRGSNIDKMGLAFNFRRSRFIMLFFVIFILIIIGRIFFLQIINMDYYTTMSSGNRIRIKQIEPNRGIIYDRNKIPLVRNVVNFMLYLIPADLPRNEDKKNDLIKKIVKILNSSSVNIITFKDVEEKLNKIKIGSLESYQPLFIKDNIEHDSAILLYLESQNMPGVVLSEKNRRKYLVDFDIPVMIASTTKTETKYVIKQESRKTESLSHILGYTGKINREEYEKYNGDYLQIDYIGKTGLEYMWEKELRGVKGEKQIEVDALGKERRIISKNAAKNGYNLIFSIDVILQAKIEEIVERHLKELGLHNSVVIVMNPNNGEILSLVSTPGFDNNKFARGITNKEYQDISNNDDKSLFNRAIKGEYPSGSTIKPVIVSAALQEKVISEYTSINSVGGIRINKWFFPDWKAGGHGATDARKAIAQSVNTFFYYIGGGYKDFTGLGVNRMLNYDKLFGLGTKTGIDLYGEADGFLPSIKWKKEKFNEPWYIGDTYHLAIGQGFLLVTPLQVANFTTVFANGGTLYKPSLIKEIVSDTGKLIKKKEPEIIRKNFIDSYNIEVVRQGMRQTITNGSARSLSNLSVKVAGKTGTAQWSNKKEPHAWFTCFAPYKNPEIVITVLVEEGGEGTYVSVPIAKEILEYYFKK